MSRLGYHVLRAGGEAIELIARTHPAVVVCYPEAVYREAKRLSPGTMFIIRPPFDDGEMPYKNPSGDAQSLFQRMEPIIRANSDWCDAVAGPNEPTLDRVGDASALSDYYVHYAQLCHSIGMKVGAYSLARGTPKMGYVVDGAPEPDMPPYMIAGARACDYHFFHVYGSRSFQDDFEYQFKRPFNFEQRLPADARRPVIITELGLDGQDIGLPQCGWQIILKDVGNKEERLDDVRHPELDDPSLPREVRQRQSCDRLNPERLVEKARLPHWSPSGRSSESACASCRTRGERRPPVPAT